MKNSGISIGMSVDSMLRQRDNPARTAASLSMPAILVA
jgi:hypothetical protein